MTSSSVMRHSETADTTGVLAEPVTSERIVPVWLSIDDLDVIDDILGHFAPASETNPDLQRHVADLQKHFGWVRSEFVSPAAIDTEA